MADFDVHILGFLNQWAGLYPQLDLLIVHQARHALLKGVVLATLLWLAWGMGTEDPSERRIYIARTVGGTFAAIAVGRLMQNLLPPRVRPLHAEHLEFVLPYGVPPELHQDMSSFPSDHAVLFFAVTVAIAMRSRLLGLIALAWTSVMICAPRIYLGYHYPSDVIVGAIVGVLIMGVALRIPLGLRAPFEAWIPPERPVPAWAGAFTFLFTYQMATLFHEVRLLLSLAGEVVGTLLGVVR